MKKYFLLFALFFLTISSINAQWEPRAEDLLPPNYSVMNLSIVNDQVVWAVAIDFSQWVPSIPSTHLPKVLRTTNGGADWSAEDFPQASGRMTYGIVGLDENTALLTTSDFDNTHELFKTTNGGDTWSMVDDGPAAGGRLMFFDATEGVSVNPLFEGIARTDDGGDHWTLLTPGVDYPAFLPNDGHLNAPTNWEIFGDTAWIGTSLGKLYRSTDKGQNWDVVYETGDITDKFISTAFVDSKNGLAVVGVFNNPPFKLLRTADGGEEWEEINNDANLSEIFAIPCTNSFIGASFYDSLSVWSTDLGTSWEILADGLIIWGPTFSSAETGWTAGIEGGSAPAVYKWTGGILNGRTYVNHAATGNNDGTSWADAYTDLQVAIDSAEAGDEIWVAEGVYLPGSDPTSTFLIDKDLKLYGGFAGTECNLSERDIVAHPTILSGDVEGDDVDDDFENFKEDNVMTIMTAVATITDMALIDGFTFRGGHADDASVANGDIGGGVYTNGSVTIRNCLFTQNYAESEGGGFFAQNVGGQGVTLTDCEFHENSAISGLAMSMFSCVFNINGCVFENNENPVGNLGTVQIMDPLGGTVEDCKIRNNKTNGASGMLIWRRATNDPGNVKVDVLNCVFEDNTSTLDVSGLVGGGCTMVTGGASTEYSVKGCIFEGNQIIASGGGLGLQTNNSSSDVKILVDDCEFSNNTAGGGAAIATTLSGNGGGEWELKNSTFTNNNTIVNYATVYVWTFTDSNAPNGTAVVDNCVFENNTSVYTGGLDIGSGTDSGPFDFTISNTSFLNNQADYCGGFDIWGDEGSKPTFHIENCLVEGNTADKRGGGFWILTSSEDFKATMDRCHILDNSSPQGAGITTFLSELNSLAFPENAEINISNSLISGNTGSTAIEIDSFPGFQLTNCTVVDNPLGAVQLSDASGLTFQNTILANNGSTEFEALTNDVTVTSNGGNLIGDNSIDASELLSSDQPGAAPDFDNAYQPTDGGNLVNRGNNNGILTDDLDLAGEQRIKFDFIDIGAYESDFTTSAIEVIAGEVSLSPNPATDFIRLQLPETINRPTDISLFDAQGKLMEQRTFAEGQAVRVGHLPEGFYTLKLSDGDQVYIGRFVKH